MQNKFRAVFSSKERAETFLSNLEKMKEEKSIEDAQYRVLKIEYTQMREDAISEINTIKNNIKRELDSKISKLEILKQEMAYLDARFKVGQLTANTYLAKEKGPKGKLIDMEKQISELLTFLNASKATDLGTSEGGFKILGINLGLSMKQPAKQPPPILTQASGTGQIPPVIVSQVQVPAPLQAASPPPPPPPPPPPTVTTTGLQIMPNRVMEGSSVGIIVTVTNVSFGNVQHKAELKINGEVKESMDVSLLPGQSQEITFVAMAGNPGDYQVNINGVTGNFSVMPAEKIHYLQ